MAKTESLTKIQSDKQAYLGEAFEISLSSSNAIVRFYLLPALSQLFSLALRGPWRTEMGDQKDSASAGVPPHHQTEPTLMYTFILK